ncbi:hypothetical protein A5773_13870 [Mycobacterium sp. 852014-52450_SCH5900713]|uniref:hypothetical protein n=1 Tax=Mycobacterium sp. 852014-52450_SCH5900713 TaxID=1834116 RepID=UPI0007FBDFAF|nr:hypothetical protein [Mycobacterium sp. 852014-52450_SCH5900713]OBF95709.1 hypothetical protein A5773_13870 [Mycobacterium sp. 852014-52450_SCH5900713]
MSATYSEAAPGILGVRAPSGDRSNPFTQEQENLIMPQTHDTREAAREANHGCQFSWCENDMDAHEAQRWEHFNTPSYVPATADSLRCLKGYDRMLTSEFVTVLGIGVRYNEDLDPAPKVVVHIHGGVDQTDADYELRIDEATMLYNELGNAIRTACNGTNLSPRRIASIYSGEDR